MLLKSELFVIILPCLLLMYHNGTLFNILNSLVLLDNWW